MEIAPLLAHDDPLRRRHHETVLLRRYTRTRDPALRRQLIEHHLPLARRIARRFGGPPNRDDLEQVAALGLVKAIDRFDPELGRTFSSFAVPTIAGEIQRHLRDHGWMVRPPRGLYELSVRAARAGAAFEQRTSRVPTLEELARETGCDVESLVEALEVTRNRRLTSLETPVAGDHTLGEALPAQENGFERAEDRLALAQELRRLPLRSRRVMLLHYFGDLTQAQIGARLGLSQMHVSRIVRESLTRMAGLPR